MKKRKALFVSFIILPLLISGGCLIFDFSKNFQLFPALGLEDVVYSYNDSADKGKSSVDNYEIRDDEIRLDYTLKRGYSYPYSGFCFVYGNNLRFLNLSAYDYFDIHLEQEGPARKSFSINVYVEGVSDLRDFSTYYTFDIKLEDHKLLKENVWRIYFKDLLIPRWWYEGYKKSPGRLKENFKNVRNINMVNIMDARMVSPEGTEGTLILKSLIFRASPGEGIQKILISLSLYYLLFILFLKNKHRFKKTKFKHKFTAFEVPPLAVPSYKDEDLSKILEYVKKNYHEPELSTAIIYKATGISTSKINRLIREAFGETFKQWLNKIRIREAERLLKETDRNIADIAIQVGYNNVFYFNKTFRTLENITPGEYRRQLSK